MRSITMQSFCRPLIILLCLILHSASACQAPKADPVSFQLNQVSPRYQPAFRSLLSALEARENETAGAVLTQLLGRLNAELEGADEATRLELEWQRKSAQKFGAILEGRKRLAALSWHLAVESEGMGQAVILYAQSTWGADQRLRPGSIVLEQESLYLAEDGQQSMRGATRVLEVKKAWDLPASGKARIVLAPYPKPMLGGALALRDGFALRLGSGSIEEGDQRFPAERWPSARGDRVNLAAFLPNGAVTPETLVAQMENPDAGMPSLIERTVRIAPDDYSEALHRIAPLLDSATPEMFDRYRPTLGWLCRHRPLPQVIHEWRTHLSQQHLVDPGE